MSGTSGVEQVKNTRTRKSPNGERRQKSLRLTLVGESCAYCGAPAEVHDHVIPKRLGKFFDAGWNLVPACHKCNSLKRDHIKLEFIRTPGNSPFEDAAIWAVVYKMLDVPRKNKGRVIHFMQKDLGSRWDTISVSLAYGAFEGLVGEHFCSLWRECQQGSGCITEWARKRYACYVVPEGLEHLLGKAVWGPEWILENPLPSRGTGEDGRQVDKSAEP